MADETGFSVDLVLSFEEALGKVRPEPDDPAPEDLISMLELPRVALEAGGDWQTHARGLRVYAESLGRIAETEGDVFHRFIELPRLEAGLSQGEMIDVVNLIGVELAPAMEKLVLAVNRPPARAGVDRRWGAAPGKRDRGDGLYERPERPTAFAFLDLTGYTRLTEERGDEAAARLTADLGRLVQEEVGQRDGRAVRWLGDGVMSSFRGPAPPCSRRSRWAVAPGMSVCHPPTPGSPLDP